MFLSKFFGFLFGKNNQSMAPSPYTKDISESTDHQLAPGTHIPYDSKLVERLKNDHHDLIQSYLSIEASFKEGDLQATVEELDDFRAALQGHLLTENVRLYIYLEHVFSTDQQSHELIHDFRYEMDGIGKVAMGFLNKYRELTNQASLVTTFAADLAEIGKVLTQRIEREEAMLYPLYMPPEQAVQKQIA